MKFSICSEVGELDTLTLRRTGKELNRLSPEDRGDLLLPAPSSTVVATGT